MTEKQVLSANAERLWEFVQKLQGDAAKKIIADIKNQLRNANAQ